MKIPALRFASLACTILSLASCQMTPHPRQTPFNEADFAPTARSGSGSVVGQICITFKDGAVRFGRNISVNLVPVNAYTTEIVNRKIIHGEELEQGDPRYEKYVRATQTDILGNFEFHNLPPGEYFVGGIVEWKDPDSTIFNDESQWAWDRVTVANGQTVKIAVNQ